MKAYYSDVFVLPLPEKHRFPMRKYSLLRERIVREHVLPPESMYIPNGATDEQLQRCHDTTYLEQIKSGNLTEKEIRRIGFPWSKGLVERSRRSTGATICAAHAALEDGISANLAGGTHHAGINHGEGFCIFNDCAVAARELQMKGQINRIAIIDCDVHQGNGTAEILAGDESIFTFSIHGEKNFPFRKIPSDLDVGLPNHTADAIYLEMLEQSLDTVFNTHQPEFVFYIAGADPFVGDRLGKLSLTKEGLAERDEMVLSACFDANIPVTVVMGGGYAPQVDDIADIHLATIKIAAQFARK